MISPPPFSNTRWTTHQQMPSSISVIFLLILLINSLLLDIAESAPHHRGKSYSLKRGSRLERHHRKSLHDWRKAYQHLGERHHHSAPHHRKRPKIHHLNLEEILQQMDAVVKPRFGRR